MLNVAIVTIVLAAAGTQATTAGRPEGRGNPVLHWNRIATEILPVEAGP
jgi:hypothetical protein